MPFKPRGVVARKKNQPMRIKLASCATLPTKYGTFKVYAFLTPDGREHLLLVKGRVRGKRHVPVRLHSQCVTGDTLGSLKCDCGPQLQAALKYLSRQRCGVLFYLQQEGRGIGLANKILAYHLQDLGLDTVDANRALGLPIDARDYTATAYLLHRLEVKSVALLTNNPSKVKSLEEEGVAVSQRIPLEVRPNPYNRRYLKAKKRKLGHLLQLKK